MNHTEAENQQKPETSTYEKMQRANPTPSDEIPSSETKPTQNSDTVETENKQDSEIKSLKENLHAIKQEHEKENKENKLRHLAEIRNLQDRHQREVAKARDYATQNFAKDLLSIADALHQGIDAAEGEQKKGLELMLDIFNKTLAKNQITPFDPINESYDPHLHEAMVMQPQPEVAHNQIIKVIQTGYMIKDRLLRPARVIVANNPN